MEGKDCVTDELLNFGSPCIALHNGLEVQVLAKKTLEYLLARGHLLGLGLSLVLRPIWNHPSRSHLGYDSPANASGTVASRASVFFTSSGSNTHEKHDPV